MTTRRSFFRRFAAVAIALPFAPTLLTKAQKLFQPKEKLNLPDLFKQLYAIKRQRALSPPELMFFAESRERADRLQQQYADALVKYYRERNLPLPNILIEARPKPMADFEASSKGIYELMKECA